MSITAGEILGVKAPGSGETVRLPVVMLDADGAVLTGQTFDADGMTVGVAKEGASAFSAFPTFDTNNWDEIGYGNYDIIIRQSDAGELALLDTVGHLRVYVKNTASRGDTFLYKVNPADVTREDVWTDTLADRLGYGCLGVGTVSADVVAAVNGFSIATGSGVVEGAELQFLTGTLAGQRLAVIDVTNVGLGPSYQTVRVAGAFSAAPSALDTFVVFAASRRQYEVQESGAVIAGNLECHKFTHTSGLTIPPWSEIVFVSGNNNGQSRAVVATYSNIVLVLPGFGSAPVAGDAFIVRPAAPSTVADALSCMLVVDSVTSATEFVVSIETAGTVNPGAWLTGAQVVVAESCQSPPSMSFVGPSRRIESVSVNGSQATITIDKAFSGTAAPNYLYVLSGVPETPTADEVAAIGPGTGVHISNVTITDTDSGDPLPDASLVVYSDSGRTALVAYAQANASGVAQVRLESETDYWYNAKCAVYAEEPGTFTTGLAAASPEAFSVTMDALAAPEAPADPDTLTIYADFKELTGLVVGATEGTFSVSILHSPALLDGASIVPTALTSDLTDANGRAQLTLARGLEVTLKLHAAQQDWYYQGTVPDDDPDTPDGGTMTLATLVASHEWEKTG